MAFSVIFSSYRRIELGFSVLSSVIYHSGRSIILENEVRMSRRVDLE